jgi:hypothetical protein
VLWVSPLHPDPGQQPWGKPEAARSPRDLRNATIFFDIDYRNFY